MAGQTIARPVFDNPFLKIEELGGDTIKRNTEPLVDADPDPEGTSPVMSKDVILDTNKDTWVRIYVPRGGDHQKLPVLFYYHGGCFVFFHANSYGFHYFCQALAESVGAVVVSLDYRLAPEHRLPAAYEDAMDGLHWIKSTQDEWIRDFADLSNVYLFGTSAGANIAYHIGLQVAATAYKEVEPLKIKGLILHHPYFSGKNRTESEEKLKDDGLLPLDAIHKLFELSLPKGVQDLDHEYCNPVAKGGSKHLEDMKEAGMRVLVTAASGDPLVDAAHALVKLLEDKGIDTSKLFGEGYHALEVFDQSMAAPLFDATRDFIYAN